MCFESTTVVVDKALIEGTIAKTFVKNFTPRLEALGYSSSEDEFAPYRLKTIYRANMAQSYNTGRYITQVANSENQPYWMRVTVIDSKTRDDHAAANGIVHKWDDPYWSNNYPPYLAGEFEFGCRYRVRPISDDRLKAMQAKNPRLAVAEPLPDIGHLSAYNVMGSAQFGTDIQIAKKIVKLENRELRQNVIQSLNDAPMRKDQFKQWIEGVIAKKPRYGGSIQPLGFVNEDVAAWMALNHPSVKFERLAAIAEKDIGHIIRDKHIKIGVLLSDNDLFNLPNVIKNPKHVYFDNQSKRVCYFDVDNEKGEFVMVVMGTASIPKKQIDSLAMAVTSYYVNFKKWTGGHVTRIK